jgi:hypothetical protein
MMTPIVWFLLAFVGVVWAIAFGKQLFALTGFFFWFVWTLVFCVILPLAALAVPVFAGYVVGGIIGAIIGAPIAVAVAIGVWHLDQMLCRTWATVCDHFRR